MSVTSWWFQIGFIFTPYLGKWSNLTNIFQMGWNHRLGSCLDFRLMISDIKGSQIRPMIQVMIVTLLPFIFCCAKKNNFKYALKAQVGPYCSNMFNTSYTPIETQQVYFPNYALIVSPQKGQQTPLRWSVKRASIHIGGLGAPTDSHDVWHYSTNGCFQK